MHRARRVGFRHAALVTASLCACLLPRASSAQASLPAAATPLPAGQEQRAHLEPDSITRFRLQPSSSSSLVEVTVAFEGAEVTATLRSGNTFLNAARAPERSRGRITVSADLAAPAPAPIELSLEVVRDYTHAADVVIQWNARAATPRDREIAARQADIYAGVEDWRDGSVERLQRAAARLKAATDGIRALDAPVLLFEALLLRGQIHADLNEREPAVAALTEAASLARARGDANDEGAAILKLSNVYASIGEVELSRTRLQEGLDLRRRAGDERGELDALSGLAAQQTNTGGQAEGLAALNDLAPLAARVGDRRMSSYIDNVRGVTLAQTGRPREALDAYGRALELRRLTGDRLGEGQTLSNMGTTWRDVGETRRGIAMMQEALAIRRAAGHRQGVANTLYNLGNAYLELSDYQQAIDCLTESLAIWRETKGLRGEAFTLQNLGLAASALGDETKAKAYFEQALPLWQKVGDRRGEGIVLNYLAGQAMRRDALDEASGFVDRALAATRTAHARREEGDALSSSGQLLRRRKDYAAAVERLREAIAVHEAIKNRNGAATAHAELGVTFEAMGRDEEALAEFRIALRLREEVGIRRGQVTSLAAIARVQRKSGALAEAQDSAMRAVDLLEQLRAGVASTRARTTLGVSTQSVYELARDILIDRHQIDPAAGYDRAALAVQERARARSLLAALNDGHPPLPASDTAAQALVDRESELEADIESKTARLGRLSDSGQPAERLTEARAELSGLVVALDDVKAEIRKRSPSYADLTQPKTLSVEALQGLFDADTALIEIALGEQRSVGWLVSATGFRTVTLPPRAEIETAARDLIAAATARNELPAGESAATRRLRIARADARLTSAAARLDTQIFAPFGAGSADSINRTASAASLAGARRIAIVADGALARVPFAMLPTFAAVRSPRSGPQSAPSAGLQRGPSSQACPPGGCAAGREVVTLPSASVLAELRSRRAARPPRTVRAAVLADPVFRADDPRVTPGAPARPGTGTAANAPATEQRDATIESLEALPRLPYSREEAKTIESLAGHGAALVDLDFAASRDALKQPAFAAPGVLHIATHAIVDETQPELSGVVLSLVDARGARVRGFLSLVEVYDLPIAADLVVLSACRTAVGADQPGEGLASLTRGFMYAGSPRVIASLWPVEDRATAAFMRAFYQALFARGLAAPAALRAAQIEMQRSSRWAAPYYWAAFTFQGDWQ
jgi:tetratricopeptide (TPR) repeat protein